MSIIYRYILRFCLVVFTVILLYFIVAFILSYLPASINEENKGKDNQIYIQSNGTHLDIVVPIAQLDSPLKRQLNLPKNTAFVCFGWGNKEFFLNVPEWKDLSLGLAFRALFFRLESVMHVIALSEKNKNWIVVNINTRQQNQLNAFIKNSFITREKMLVLCKRNTSGSNCFYDAQKKYSCINTCNVWVNDALKKADVPTSVWSPFSFGVLHHLR